MGNGMSALPFPDDGHHHSIERDGVDCVATKGAVFVGVLGVRMAIAAPATLLLAG